MATMPCDRHRAPQRGRLCGLYPVLLKDGTRLTKYRRLCVPCMQDLLISHASDWKDSQLAFSSNEQQACSSCGVVVENSGQLTRFYATAYLDGKNRRDYYAMYCDSCVSTCVSEFEFDV